MIELLEHNKPTYADLCEKMEKHNKVALVQATGTGKSYIIGKYLEEHKGKTLILVPTNAIGDQWEKLMAETNCDVTIDTYQGMSTHIDDESEYDIVIADEMHHLGSEVWGSAFVNLFIRNATQKVIGTTATEIRYLDNSRNMVEELFDGVAVRGCDLRTAIENGILPTFTYVSVWYENDKDYEEYTEKAQKIRDSKAKEQALGKLELCKKNQRSIEQAIAENLSDEPHKIIVFMNSIDSMEKDKKKIRQAFSANKAYKINSSMNKTQIQDNISGFKSADNGNALLFAIDMLNEGVHIDGVDTVAFFRTTESPAVYFQQLGRCLAVSKPNKKRTVFDFVCNSSNIRNRLKTRECNSLIDRINKELPENKRIITQNYTRELSDLFLEIENNISIPKISEEIKKEIIDNKSGLTRKELADKYGVDKSYIYLILKEAGLTGTPKRLENEIVEIIRNNPNLTNVEIQDKFNIPYDVVKRYRVKHNLDYKRATRNELSESEKAYIKKHSDMSIKELSQIIDKGKPAVSRYLKEVGIIKCKRRLCEKDREYIISHPTDSIKDMAEKLGLSVHIVTRVRSENGIKKPKKYIEYNGEKLTLSQWSEKTGIKKSTIRERLKRGWSFGKALGYE